MPCDGVSVELKITTLPCEFVETRAICQIETARRRSVLGETPLSWQGNSFSSSRAASGFAVMILFVESGDLLSGLVISLQAERKSIPLGSNSRSPRRQIRNDEELR